jgi:hypothetical protein
MRHAMTTRTQALKIVVIPAAAVQPCLAWVRT